MLSKKRVNDIPARLQKFILRQLKYDMTTEYVHGETIPVADALSGLNPMPPRKQEETHIESTLLLLPTNNTQLDAIRAATAEDQTLRNLARIVLRGWPERERDVPEEVMPYYTFREDIAVKDGFLLKIDRIIIPLSLRPIFLRKIHEGHLGET